MQEPYCELLDLARLQNMVRMRWELAGRSHPWAFFPLALGNVYSSRTDWLHSQFLCHPLIVFLHLQPRHRLSGSHQLSSSDTAPSHLQFMSNFLSLSYSLQGENGN